MSDLLVKIICLAVEAALVCCSFLICILRKKVELIDTPFEKLLEELPKVISIAEKHFINGSQKKEFVLGVAYSFLHKYTGKDIDDLILEYGDRISSSVESILSTPQKKGV